MEYYQREKIRELIENYFNAKQNPNKNCDKIYNGTFSKLMEIDPDIAETFEIFDKHFSEYIKQEKNIYEELFKDNAKLEENYSKLEEENEKLTEKTKLIDKIKKDFTDLFEL